MNTPAIVVMVGAALGGGLGVITQSDTLTPGQTWTLVGVLAMLVAGLGKAIHWIGTRFLTQMDKRDEKLSSVIEKNSEVVGANTTATLRLGEELRTLAAQQRELPRNIADEIARRKNP